MNKNLTTARTLLAALHSVVLAIVLSGGAHAADDVKALPAPATASPNDLVRNGDARCTKCHDPGDTPALVAIGRTRHGVRADGRTPGCTSCHGESANHLSSRGKTSPDLIFKAGAFPLTEAGVLNQSCLSCHGRDLASHLWLGSAHDSNGVACTSCHQVCAAQDPVLDKRSQPEVCYSCHKAQRAQFNKPSRHPTPEGKVACSDCHNAHGSAGPKLLKRDSVVETCYACHMEKRGPFLNDHQPVGDDCGNCHAPHGSSADSLLKARVPQLCYQCHTGHAQDVGRNSPKRNLALQASSCLNCHTEIHGSNSVRRGQNLLTPR